MNKFIETIGLLFLMVLGFGKLRTQNLGRIPDYIRADVALNIEGNHKVHKKIHGPWSLSVYNLLGRSNAYSVFFKNEGGQINGYELTVFKSVIPTITYHFKLQ